MLRPRPTSWAVRHAIVATGPGSTNAAPLLVDDGRVSDTTSGQALDLSGCLVLPGFINAHEHLEFALFPRLGKGPYRNAGEWYADISKPDEPPIQEHLLIPKRDRLVWGGLRNLVCGVTTVSHHNPPDGGVFGWDFPVHVLRSQGWAHSVGLDPAFAERHAATLAHAPFIIHLGESVDGSSGDELSALAAAGALTARTVLVHGVDLSPALLAQVRRAGASIIWCPSSNDFLLRKTIGRNAFAVGIPICLGSDSPLTAAGDWLDEIRSAAGTGLRSPDQIYRMLFDDARKVLRLLRGRGTLTSGALADLIAIADTGAAPADALANLELHLVMLAGEIKLVSGEYAERLPRAEVERLEPLRYRQRDFLVDAPVTRLLAQAKSILGQVRLSGKEVSSGVSEHPA